MYEQLRGNAADLGQWLDNMAHASVQVFSQPDALDTHDSAVATAARRPRIHSRNLVAPLIAKLPRAVRGGVLKAAGQLLNAVSFEAYSSHEVPAVSQSGSGSGGTSLASGGAGGGLFGRPGRRPRCPCTASGPSCSSW